MLRLTVSRPVRLGVKHPFGAYDLFLFLSSSCGFVDVERPLSREDGSVFYNVQSQSYVTIDGQSASLSSFEAPIWGLRPDSCYCQTVAGLLMWGALSDERTGLPFTTAAGPRQRSHSWVQVPYCCLRLETPPTWRVLRPACNFSARTTAENTVFDSTYIVC
jgi:hypothetical protein